MIVSYAIVGAIIVGAVLILWIIGVYNSLIKLRSRYRNSYAQIDVQLKRRYDLIPNLVETVKGYLQHESETLEAVVRARGAAFAANQNAVNRPGDPNAMGKLSAAEGALSGALGRLLAVAESYPELKGNQNMLALQEELTSTENKISFARQNYNDCVSAYNTKRELFPTVVVASLFNFEAAALFEINDPTEREAPKVKF